MPARDAALLPSGHFPFMPVMKPSPSPPLAGGAGPSNRAHWTGVQPPRDGEPAA